MKVYLDNAATTQLDERVFEAMKPYLLGNYGNPSSIHSHGREARSAIEQARRKVAEMLGASPAEIFFTSGGTEADNTIIRNAITRFGIKTAISSRIEHHAVLHTLQHLETIGQIRLLFVDLDARGQIDYTHLEKLLEEHPNAFVSLMHVNNEIGNITSLDQVGALCRNFGAYFHTDAVQSIGLIAFDLNSLQLDALACSAHKFHGPKGVGLMYIKAGRQFSPLMIGGGQERNMRGGTENTAGIIGLAKAMEIAVEERKQTQEKLTRFKKYTINQVRKIIPQAAFNGLSDDLENGLPKILSISIPDIEDNDMLLFNLDIAGISVSGGSACASGSSIGSHVLDALNLPVNTGAIRVSFSKYNTIEEIDYFVEKLAERVL